MTVTCTIRVFKKKSEKKYFKISSERPLHSCFVFRKVTIVWRWHHTVTGYKPVASVSNRALHSLLQGNERDHLLLGKENVVQHNDTYSHADYYSEGNEHMDQLHDLLTLFLLFRVFLLLSPFLLVIILLLLILLLPLVLWILVFPFLYVSVIHYGIFCKQCTIIIRYIHCPLI